MMWWFTGGGGWRGGVVTANWLHVEGRGRGGGVSLDTFTGKGYIVGEGGGGGPC